MQIQPTGTQQIQRTGTQQLIVILLGILVVIMLGGVLYLTSSIVLPFMVALFLAYLLDPLVRFLKYCRVPLALAVCFALLVTFIFLALMGMLFYASAQSFVREYPAYEPKLRALVNLCLLILQVDFAVLWGALAFLLNFIPHVGAPISIIPPVLVAILKFDTLMPAVWVLVSVTLIHVVLGSFIEPRLMGRSLHIS